MKRARANLVLAAAVLASGCTVVGSDYEPPSSELSTAWHADPEGVLAPEPAELERWWAQLGDPVLDELIARAAAASLDVRAAFARLAEARALRGVTAADYYPAVDARAGWERRGESENTPFGEFVPDAGIYSLGIDAAWELDLWGRVRRSVEAADADLAASVEDLRDVAVTVAAEVARTYVDVRAFQLRIAIARRNVELQQETLALVQARLDAGLVGERDVAQARTNLETTRARVPALEASLRAAENRLAVLLGERPGALADELAGPADVPLPPARLAVGVPADLLRRRADVRRAERVVAAEHARIGVAEGDLYPRLSLFGTLGVAAEDAGDLWQDASGVFAIGPSLRWNLFDGGRLRGRVVAQEARAEQALVAWEGTVLLALEETENAMTSFLREQARRRALAAAVEQARLAVELARTQYGEGLSDFQTVLDSERTVADLEDQLAESDAAIATNLVALYKALGGGWEAMGATEPG